MRRSDSGQNFLFYLIFFFFADFYTWIREQWTNGLLNVYLWLSFSFFCHFLVYVLFSLRATTMHRSENGGQTVYWRGVARSQQIWTMRYILVVTMMLMIMMMSCKLVQIWNTRFVFTVTTMMAKSSLGECIKIQILEPTCFHQFDINAEFEDDHLLADRGPDRLWKTNARNILWMFSHWRFCNHPISYLCTFQPLIIHWETQNIVMPYFLVLSSAETGKVKQIIFRFAQCLFHICWEFPLATEQNHICSWNKFILVGKQIPATSAQCFDIREVRMITKPCNLVWMVFFGHKSKGWPQLSKPMCANPVKVLGKFKWTLLKQIFLFFWKYLTVICPGPHLPKTKPCPICSCFMDHL